jgi:betaine-aldehyde dehydrogenase
MRTTQVARQLALVRATTANLSPRDGSALAPLPVSTAADVDAAVALGADVAASASWGAREAVGARAGVLHALAAAVRGRREELARLESVDMGKALVESRADVAFCADVLDYYAALAPRALADAQIELDAPPFAARVVPSAVGVVGCVTPWNYPLLQATAKLAPALAAGCAVVLKPSPLASLSCLQLGAMAEAAGAPRGALSVVTGGPPAAAPAGADEDGAHRLLAHPHLAKLSLTGSERAGGAALRAAAEHVRPTALELGGKGAMLVFEDAALEAAVGWCLLGAFANAGQVCSATSRLLVHRPIAARFTDMLVRAAAALRVGDPLAEGVAMGALVSAARREAVLAAVASSRAAGATLLLGGGPAAVPGLNGGYYMEPTILASAPRDSAAWRDELFGPVLAVASFEDEAEALALANDSRFGLAHAVFSADAARCERVAAALDAGTVWVNCSQLVWPATPFGGWKASGFGREYGLPGLQVYLRYKTISAAPAGQPVQ